MSVKKTILIDQQPVLFKASAAIPRLYRIQFGRDIYQDLKLLENAVKKQSSKNSQLDIVSLELFENIAFIMAKHADNSLPDKVDEWLERFSTFSIYQVLPQLIELWGLNLKSHSQSKKSSAKPKGR
ncbi:hypothetical protein I4Q36_05135 [Tuanshanicoccus lijuaniae]|uniref:hypothetical protein n=1 Tax=Aerococcaceae bacterium zg-1292 TaxID=2774330 RepID=UPI001938BB15|nr:hypothetical protein [Aerococcaceae bacterium zg-1292]QQA38056.1 hypothetical protein I4Q36_05135 [Aerococcaceae bacterium zg-1292]